MTVQASGARVVAAPDKFRGTASAPEIAEAIARAAASCGFDCARLPLADGGEGTVDVFGGANRFTTVTGPAGTPVEAGWRFDVDAAGGPRAVVEMATASGLLLAGGAERNDPWAATTRGTGEVIAAAIAEGAVEIIVGVGGSATTDGGAGALEVLAPHGGPSIVPVGTRITVCADVRTRFLDAARVFGPQKGAGPEMVAHLTARLAERRADYVQRFGVDVAELDRSGAAGGLAGGLAAIGAELVDGFGAIADAVGLDAALDGASLAVTGEGRFDATSLRGKVVGGVVERATRRGVPVLVVCGSADPDVEVPDGTTVIDLVTRCGEERAHRETAMCAADAVEEFLRSGL